jgi:hypothetical protein
MTDTQFQDLDRFVSYAQKQFDLPLLAGCFADRRDEPEIPSRAVGLSLLLGEVIQTPGLSQLEEETKLPQWQQWVGYHDRISHDTFGYAANRMNPEQLRRACRFINRKLKRGKALEASKMHGLLVVSLDANEQFCSDHRCCADCLTREVTCKDAQGNEFKKTQYYHKQVYAQLSGPRLSVILDVEPMRPGEEECAAALRLLRRMRRTYGPRFFDLVVVDSWYTNGPFLKTVAEELGWPVVAVLKQERYDIYQEALALTRGKPTPGGDLGCGGVALQRYLYQPGSGGPRAGELDGANATGQGVEDRGKRTNLDLGGGGRPRYLRRSRYPGLRTLALEDRE